MPVSPLKQMISGRIIRDLPQIVFQGLRAVAEDLIKDVKEIAPVHFPDDADQSLQDRHGFIHLISLETLNKPLRVIFGQPDSAGNLFKFYVQ